MIINGWLLSELLGEKLIGNLVMKWLGYYNLNLLINLIIIKRGIIRYDCFMIW